jgi:hypothetical protein
MVSKLNVYDFTIIVPLDLSEALCGLYSRDALHGVKQMTDAKEVASLISKKLGVGIDLITVQPGNRNGHK